MNAYVDSLSTPVGAVAVAVDDDGRLMGVDFIAAGEEDRLAAALRRRGYAIAPGRERCAEVRRQLGEYFAGRRRAFDLEVVLDGSPFQRRVWAELRRIPYGGTLSYGQLAARLGAPGAARAVGRANATNPVPIVVPCHRVVGADGSLTGFGGGIAAKRALLALEGAFTGEQGELAFGEQ
jgi:methylated-DNA-[protein]-cysteine S-methyltransferase